MAIRTIDYLLDRDARLSLTDPSEAQTRTYSSAKQEPEVKA